MWNEFLDCPFCGGRPVVKCYPTMSMVKCVNCSVGMSSHGPEHKKQVVDGVMWLEDLAGKWNNRECRAAELLGFVKSLQLSVADEIYLNKIMWGGWDDEL